MLLKASIVTGLVKSSLKVMSVFFNRHKCFTFSHAVLQLLCFLAKNLGNSVHWFIFCFKHNFILLHIGINDVFYHMFQTITDFLGTLGWEYVVVVYTENSYGRGAYKAIRTHMANAGLCLTAAIGADPTDDSDDTIDGILRSVLQMNATGVVYLGNDALIEALLHRGELYDGAGKLQWVVTDSVSISDRFPGQKYPRGQHLKAFWLLLV